MNLFRTSRLLRGAVETGPARYLLLDVERAEQRFYVGMYAKE